MIDKLPLNLFRLPFVHAVFPGAKVVFSVRHPFDVCLSCFMQSFEANSAMANFYSLDDTVSLYVEAMGRWGAYVDQAEITHHVVRYEDLISDLEAQARELLGFLGLPWNDLVLRSDEAARNKRLDQYAQLSSGDPPDLPPCLRSLASLRGAARALSFAVDALCRALRV